MFWIDLLLALVVAIVLTLVFVFVVRRRGPWESTYLFFVIVFLGAWAGGLWLKPVGPPYNGFYFINYIVAGLILAVLIAAAGPAAEREEPAKKIELKTQDELREEKKLRNIKRIDLLLSILIVFLILIILLSYVVVL